jgi:serine O-acetyltransferase
MIKNKDDYKYYLAEDRKRLGSFSRPLWEWINKSERWYIWLFIRNLRKVEYLQNTNTSLFRKILYRMQLIKFYRIMHKTQIYIYPNVVGPGLCIPHLGYMLISSVAEIGKNFTVRPGGVIASNLGTTNNKIRKVIIGDNVELSAGCYILCKKIGSNVSIGANAVVMKNIPDNHIAFGNPAELDPKPIQ